MSFRWFFGRKKVLCRKGSWDSKLPPYSARGATRPEITAIMFCRSTLNSLAKLLGYSARCSFFCGRSKDCKIEGNGIQSALTIILNMCRKRPQFVCALYRLLQQKRALQVNSLKAFPIAVTQAYLKYTHFWNKLQWNYCFCHFWTMVIAFSCRHQTF